MKRVFAAAVYLCAAVCVYAQIATTTALVGTVTDSSGKVIAGAKVTARNTATLDAYTSVTNRDGYYRIDFVRVGTYDVSAENLRFAKVEKTGSVVDMNQIVRNDFTLSPGVVTQSVTVEASASLIKTDSATISRASLAERYPTCR